MPFLQLILPTTREDADQLSDALSEMGALAVTLQDAEDQPIYAPGVGEPTLWDHIILSALFEENTDIPEILSTLQNQFSALPTKNATVELIADQSWEHTWKDDFKAQCYQNKLWVYPSWDLPADRPTQSLILDPGLAFGTGKHPTTQMCLTWLAENIHDQSLIIDYGCGSGILAIAALKLGAKKALAVDNDPQALTATRSNAEINAISNQQLETYLPEDLPSTQADILIANILATPLIELSYTFSTLLKPNAKIVLSGILNDQVPQILEAYSSWITLHPTNIKGDWALISS